jgi:hypothetical protein
MNCPKCGSPKEYNDEFPEVKCTICHWTCAPYDAERCMLPNCPHCKGE